MLVTAAVPPNLVGYAYMARSHAAALGRNSAHDLAKVVLLLASASLSSCAAVPWTADDGEDSAGWSSVYLETYQFVWVDTTQRQRLACVNGTALICRGAVSRLSPAHCGCLPDD